MKVGNRSQTYRSLWATGEGGTFPMVGINGSYYRLLTEPASVSDSLLGGTVATVDTFTTEPALTAKGSVMSNVVTEGTAVQQVKGMGDTLVAARVDGTLRVFQRVSFNGTALRGSEKLKDTLQLSGHIRSMSLSSVGTVSDAAECERLFSLLTVNAVYESSGSLTNRQSLLITLDNGLTVQMIVKGDKLAACGVWSCPEFIEAFEAAAQ